ncbi:hypothetical protein BOX15_Mlig025637g1, partial [Macrostomum lignano]
SGKRATPLAEADAHLREKRYVEAMLAYSMLIDSPDGQQSGFLPDAYAGRSECLRQLEQLYHSLEDADRVCLLRPRWPRGHALRGEALLAGVSQPRLWQLFAKRPVSIPATSCCSIGRVVQWKRFAAKRQQPAG